MSQPTEDVCIDLVMWFQYRFDAESGVWSHRSHSNTVMNLTDVSFKAGKMNAPNHPENIDVMHMDKKFFDVSSMIF